jgi:hypothetical protein
MADQQDSGFQFVDKRHTSAQQDDTPAENVSSSQEEEDAASSDPENPEVKHTVTVLDHMITCVEILHKGAWLGMGLIADPVTNEIKKDMEGARAAIDTVEFIAKHIEDKLDPKMQRELKNLLNDLRLNYVEQMKR